MVGVGGPSATGSAGSGSPSGAAASATNPIGGIPDFIAQATQAAAQAQQGASGTFQVYTGTSNQPYVNTGGDVRVGLTKSVQNFQQSDQYTNFLIGLQTTNPSLYKQYQQLLAKAGYYGSGKPVLGTYTGQDGQAISAFLNDYNAYNTAHVAAGQGYITPEAYLNQTIKLGGSALQGAGRAPLTVTHTDPATLRLTLQSAAQQALGRDLNDKELASFVSSFQSKETSSQTAAYNNDSSVTQPDASADATEYVLGTHGQEHDEKLAAGYLDSINQMLGVL